MEDEVKTETMKKRNSMKTNNGKAVAKRATRDLKV